MSQKPSAFSDASVARSDFWRGGCEPDPADAYLDLEGPEDWDSAQHCPRCGRVAWETDRVHCEGCRDFKDDPTEEKLQF